MVERCQVRFEQTKKLYLRFQACTRQAWAQEPDSRAHRHRLAATRVGLGRVYLATGAFEQAADAWARAETIMKPLTAGSNNVAYPHTHALALLHLASTEEVQPMVETLLAKG